VATSADIATYLDELLRTGEIDDYPPALNGLQLANRGAVTKVAAAVDLSRATVEGAIASGANLLLVHHGMFWGGLRPIRGAFYERVARLIEADVAVYASHLPLDAHPTLGNNALLAAELGLTPSGAFAWHQKTAIGVRGEGELATAELVERARRFARGYDGEVRTSEIAPGRMTRRWGICTGAGADADTLKEAVAEQVDTLVVGEGPHWTAVDAPELGLVIIYAGHYATETLGVRALAAHVAERYGLPWMFVHAPTGL
jgi:dinuclear metal center YbgI/SA1388 family protein